MGRSYFVDEAVQKYLTKAAKWNQNDFVTGILIGQCSAQRDYVVLAIQTPPKEDPGERAGKMGDLTKLDKEWFCIHAGQVARMLPGGFLLVGAFLISPPEVSNEAPNALRDLVFATEKFAMRNKLWSAREDDITDRVALQICSSTNKIVCRTFDVRDPKSTAKPADWKYQNTSQSWLSVECNVDMDLVVSLPASASYVEQQTCTRARLAEWAQDVDECTFLFNGQLKDKDGDLLEDQKKGRSANSSPQIVSATILAPTRVSGHSAPCVEPYESSLRMRGVVNCRGYVCNNKPKVKDAIQAVKRDLLNTMSDRCDIMFEVLRLNAAYLEPTMCPRSLPQRVFAPIPGSGATLCDYIIGEETKDDVENRFLEMLDQEVNYDDLHFAEERMSGGVEENQKIGGSGERPNVQESAAREEMSLSNLPQTIGFVIAIAVVLLAILGYLLE